MGRATFTTMIALLVLGIGTLAYLLFVAARTDAWRDGISLLFPLAIRQASLIDVFSDRIGKIELARNHVAAVYKYLEVNVGRAAWIPGIDRGETYLS